MIHCYNMSDLHYGSNLISIPGSGLLADNCGDASTGQMGNWTNANTLIDNFSSCTGFDECGIYQIIGEGVAATNNSILGWVGSLDRLEPEKGYWIKMSAESCNIEVCVVPENPLDSGELYMSWDNFEIGGQFFTSPYQWCEIYGECPGDTTDCPTLGCTDSTACNYDDTVSLNDGSCFYQYEDPFSDGIDCMAIWAGNAGDMFGQGPWDCDCVCIGNTGAPVDDNGYDCNGYCGGFSQAGNEFFNITDCLGNCISMEDWILYRDNPLTFTSCDPRFACYDPPTSFALGNDPDTDPNVGGLQIDGSYINFSCGDSRCLDECGNCNGDNDCADCNNVFGGNAVYDGYQTQTLPLLFTEGTGGCCLESSMLQYWVDSDGDGLGDTENPNSGFGSYLLCPNNPNIITHSLVPNFLDTCMSGTIDICGCCSSTLKNVNTGADCTINGCIGCMDDSACNTNYKSNDILCDGGTCTINCTNCCIYPSDNCHNCPVPFGDGACNCETGEGCGCGILHDECGICGGDNSTCLGCDGVPNSGYQICNVDTACNYGDCVIGDPTGNAGCIYPPLYYNCDGSCENDTDGDGICDELDITGCTDPSACNYLPSATINSGCEYAEEYYNCDGSCISDSDGDGVCDEIETGGCTDSVACNYNSTATDDDGTCAYAEENFDCDGNCLIDVDCAGVCGGSDEDLGCGCGNAAPDADGCCSPQVDEGCACGNPAPGECGCDLSIVDEGCGCGFGAPTLDCANNPNGTHICGGTELCDYQTCTQPEENYDCDGNCIVETDCANVCGGTAQWLDCGCDDSDSCLTCTYPLAENYNSTCNPSATIGQEGFCIDDGSCTFALFAEPYQTTITTTAQIPSVTNDISYPKGYFPFYYPFDESIRLLDIYNNIWMENPDEYCLAQMGDGWNWDDCDVSGLATLTPIDGDVVNAWSTDGMGQAIIRSGGSWFGFSNDTFYLNIGNADEAGCDPTDFENYAECTRIKKGFVGELVLEAADEDRQTILESGTPLAYFKFRKPLPSAEPDAPEGGTGDDSGTDPIDDDTDSETPEPDVCGDSVACNYGQDGECIYPEENFDCDGNCLVNVDCNGVCGGTAVIDDCGVCNGDGTSCLEMSPFICGPSGGTSDNVFQTQTSIVDGLKYAKLYFFTSAEDICWDMDYADLFDDMNNVSWQTLNNSGLSEAILYGSLYEYFGDEMYLWHNQSVTIDTSDCGGNWPTIPGQSFPLKLVYSPNTSGTVAIMYLGPIPSDINDSNSDCNIKIDWVGAPPGGLPDGFTGGGDE